MPQKGSQLDPYAWKYAGSLYFSNPRADLPLILPYQFTSRVIKTQAEARSVPGNIVKPTWRKAAYLSQFWKGAELDNKIVPVNLTKVFQLSDLADRYQLQFDPVSWLPNLRILVWEYAGAWIPEDFNADDGEILDDGEF